ncbi:MAG TPA: class I tRNA ligase family protein, partial [Flavobacteriales bacterium]|nr:class I tRNA ligase family protein [Flavobacteriales bacterium]
LYKLTWDDFCAWYLEAVKPAYQQPIDKATLEATKRFFEDILRLLHPFTPFVTEEIWHFLAEREEGTYLMLDRQPALATFDSNIIQQFEQIRNTIAAVRNFRNEKGISPKEALQLSCSSRTESASLPFMAVLTKLANISEVNYVTEKPSGSFQLMVGTDEFFLPANESMDLEAEREKMEKELVYTRGFLESVMKKLQNERFMANAKPEVVEVERRKEADALQKIKALEEQLSSLAN